MEKALHAGMCFFTSSGSCNLFYALFIFKQIRHACCQSLHVSFDCNGFVYIVPRLLSSSARMV